MVGGAGGGGGKDLGGRRGRKRTCPRFSNAAGLNTHAGTPRHASIAPEVPRKIILSPRLVPNALLLATSHLLNITSVSTIRMLAGVWAAVHARACADLEATPTNSALQEQPRFKLEAWNRFCRKAPTLVLTSLRYLLFLSVDLCPRLIFKDLQKKEKAGLYRKKSVRSFSRLGWSPSAKGHY